MAAVAGVEWVAAQPSGGARTEVFPACADADAVELVDVEITGAAAAEAVVLDRPELVNVTLESCDVTGVVGRSGRANRLLVRSSRLRAVTWVDGIVQDATFEDITGIDVSFRFSTLRRVVLRDCALPALDLTEAVFDKVLLQRCDLRGARFDGSKVKALRIEGCDLTGCTGAGSLAGATLDPDDLLSLGPSMATALGLTVE
jgi:uncharacterized protein YjbI with pentapeptide repeats